MRNGRRSYKINKIYKRLQTILREYQEHGTEVIFFEMPVNCVFSKAKRIVQLKKLQQKYFGDGSFSNLNTNADCSEYYSNDGSHLIPSSAEKFKNLMLKKLKLKQKLKN